MNIKFVTGDMFASNAEAIVNTVNCVGVMGKGVALEFKRRWPDNYKAYKKACDQKWLRPGRLLIFEIGSLVDAAPPRFLINFPTKDHWKQKSKIEYIESGLDALVQEVERTAIRSIAMPPLGCGNGGLNWNIVKPIIEKKLAALRDVNIEVYEPSAQQDAPEYVDVASKMTLGRAMYLKAIASLEVPMGGSVDRLSLQKIAYFLQALGIPMNLSFENSLYGPYSDVLKKSIRVLQLWRYIDGLDSEHRSVHVTPAGFAAADEYLKSASAENLAVDKLLHLVDGYESPYGFELLSTIHFELTRQSNAKGIDGVVGLLTSGDLHRRNSFTEEEVRRGFSRLAEDEMIGPNRQLPDELT